MKKTLGFILVCTSLISLSGCKKKEDKTVIKDDFYEPQINVPQIYLSKGADFGTNEALKQYLLEFAKVTFDDDHLNEEFNLTLDTGDLDISKLNAVSKFEVKYTITFNGQTKTQNAVVDVVDRGVVGIEIDSEIEEFKPSINFTGDKVIDYTKGLKIKDSNGQYIPDLNDAIKNGKIILDDSTVRLAVPGVHLVKFIIFCENNYKYYYYREVRVAEPEVPTKQDFEKYFTYDSEGLKCNRGVNYPKVLFVPSKYKDGNTIVNVENYNHYSGCNFRDVYDNNVANRTLFRNVDTIIYGKGHKELPTFFFALDYQNKELNKEEDAAAKTTSSISRLELPETLKTIGTGIISGTDVKQVIIPRSVEQVNKNVFASAWKVETVVFLGMPVAENGTTLAIVQAFFLHYTRKSVYFFADYMLGLSEDEVKNDLFRYTYMWMRTNGYIHNLNSFANYNKILL